MRCDFGCEYANRYTQKVVWIEGCPHWEIDEILCYRSGDVENKPYMKECPYYTPTEVKLFQKKFEQRLDN